MDKTHSKKPSVRSTQSDTANTLVQADGTNSRAPTKFSDEIISANTKSLFEYAVVNCDILPLIAQYLSLNELLIFRLLAKSCSACMLPLLKLYAKVSFSDVVLKDDDFKVLVNEKPRNLYFGDSEEFEQFEAQRKRELIVKENVQKWLFACANNIPKALKIVNMRIEYLFQAAYKKQSVQFNILSLGFFNKDNFKRIQDWVCSIPNDKNTNLASLHIQDSQDFRLPFFPNLRELSFEQFNGKLTSDDSNNVKTLRIDRLGASVDLGLLTTLENLSIGLSNSKIVISISAANLTNLQSLSLRGKGDIILPPELSELTHLKINSKNFVFPDKLNKLKSFECPALTDSIFDKIKSYATNLTSLIFGVFYDDSYENKKCLELLSLATNLEVLKIDKIYAYDEETTVCIKSLKYLSINEMDGRYEKPTFLLSDEMSQLETIIFHTIPEGAYIQLPGSLDYLILLEIGDVGEDAIIQIPDILPKVCKLVLRDADIKVQFSDKTCSRIIDCLHIFPNLKELTIGKIINQRVNLCVPDSCQRITIESLINTDLTLEGSVEINLNIRSVDRDYNAKKHQSQVSELSISNPIRNLSISISDKTTLKLSGSISLQSLQLAHSEGKLVIETHVLKINELFIKGYRGKIDDSGYFAIEYPSGESHYVGKFLQKINDRLTIDEESFSEMETDEFES